MRALSLEQIDKLLKLTEELANQILRARVAGRPISEIEALAIVDALHLLQSYKIVWPDKLKMTLEQYDELCGRNEKEREHQTEIKSEVARLPRVDALPWRVFSMLGFK